MVMKASDSSEFFFLTKGKRTINMDGTMHSLSIQVHKLYVCINNYRLHRVAILTVCMCLMIMKVLWNSELILLYTKRILIAMDKNYFFFKNEYAHVDKIACGLNTFLYGGGNAQFS